MDIDELQNAQVDVGDAIRTLEGVSERLVKSSDRSGMKTDVDTALDDLDNAKDGLNKLERTAK